MGRGVWAGGPSSIDRNTTRQELLGHPGVQGPGDMEVTLHKPQSLQQEPGWGLHLCSHPGWCLPPGLQLGGCSTSPMASSEMTSLKPGQSPSPGWGLLRRVSGPAPVLSSP